MWRLKKYNYRPLKHFICFFVSFLLVFPGYSQTASNIKSLLSEEGQVLFGDEPNSIMVIDYPENVRKVEEYLKMVDVPPKQVHIEARIVEVKLQNENTLGIDWTLFAASGGWNFGNFDMYSDSASSGITTSNVIDYQNINYPPISGSTTNVSPFTLTLVQNNINAVLKTLAHNYDTDILSAPSVTTINNHEAVIQMIDVYPWLEPGAVSGTGGTTEVDWTAHFEEAGIILKVTPTISEDGKIVMDLQPEVSSKTTDYEVTVDTTGNDLTYTIPIIETRQARTKVVVGNGETLIIGGMIKNKDIVSEIKIPLLGDIPYLGYLFKSTKKTLDKSELVIFVSPTIVEAPQIAYSTRLEKEIRKDVEGYNSKINPIPLKEVKDLKQEEVVEKVKEAVEEVEKGKAKEEKIKKENLQKERIEKRIKALYSEAVKFYTRNQLKKARSLFEKILDYDPNHQETLLYLETKIPEKAKKLEASRKARQVEDKKNEKAKKLYKEGLSLYRKKQYAQAWEKFKLVQEVLPNYADTATYLKVISQLREKQKKLEEEKKKQQQIKAQEEKRAQEDKRRQEEKIAQEKKKAQQELEKKRRLQKQAQRLYRQGLSLYRKKRYEVAYSKFQEVQKLSPNYSQTQAYLAKIPKLIERQQRIKRVQEEKERQQAVERQAKQLYQDALSFYKRKKYSQAYEKFQKVQALISGYRKTPYFLRKIPELIERQKQRQKIQKQRERQRKIKKILDSYK